MVALCGPRVPGDHGQRDELDAVVGGREVAVDQSLDVLVVDVLLAVGEVLEPHERVLELVVREVVAHVLQLGAEGGAA
jgi:hypothetical protein